MTLSKAIELYSEHLRTSVKKRTQEGYNQLLGRLQGQFSCRQLEDITAEELCRCCGTFTEGLAKATRRLRYAQLRAIFNFCIDTFQMNIKNPCSVPHLFKTFKSVQQQPMKILDKKTIDHQPGQYHAYHSHWSTGRHWCCRCN